MKATEFQLPVSGQAIAFVRAWLPDGEPRGALQIVHGLAEHSGRYARLATRLAEAGFAVYSQDLPAHGRTARAPDELGRFVEGAGWPLALQSVRCLQGELPLWHPGVPLFMFSHAMGSFLLRDYLSRHSQDLAGVIMSGGTADMGALRRIGLHMLRAEAFWSGVEHRSMLAEKLTFGGYNRRFAPARTPFDWLSTQPDEVDRYMADPHCGFRCSIGLWLELLAAIGRVESQPAARVPPTLPLLLIAGEDDPVCGGRKGPLSLQHHYRDAGVEDVTVRTYPKGRHEILNDQCRDQVEQDLLDWLALRTS